LTEAVAAGAPELLVGATDWCGHPAGLDVVRIGGTKNPDTAKIAALAPDLVIANEEENRSEDVAALRAAGLRVLVTEVRSVSAGLAVLARVRAACGLDPSPGWLVAARAAWAGPVPPARATALVPIWRRPWMALGRDTFAGDVLARLAVANALSGADARYPAFALGELPPHDLVVLPDEPYAFGPADAGAFDVPVRFVSGRHLTWYGPSLAEAREVLAGQLWTQVSRTQ
jgi:hypothetical protein